ncbi:hypothetical protein [Aliarcobacter cryaerophilus]
MLCYITSSKIVFILALSSFEYFISRIEVVPLAIFGLTLNSTSRI